MTPDATGAAEASLADPAAGLADAARLGTVCDTGPGHTVPAARAAASIVAR